MVDIESDGPIPGDFSIFFCSHFICFLGFNKNKITKTANGKSYRRFSSTKYFY